MYSSAVEHWTFNPMVLGSIPSAPKVMAMKLIVNYYILTITSIIFLGLVLTQKNISKTNARNWFKRITLSLEITLINTYIRLSDKDLLVAFLSILYLTKFSLGFSFEECTLCEPSSSIDQSGEELPTSVADTDVSSTNEEPTTPKYSKWEAKSKWQTWGWGADGPREYDNPIFWGYMAFTAIAVVIYFVKYGIPK